MEDDKIKQVGFQLPPKTAEAISRINNNFAQTLLPMVNVARQFNQIAKQYEPVFTAISETTKIISEASKAISKSLNPYFEKLPEIIKALEALPKKTSEALLELAERGWYFDPEMYITWPIEVADSFKSGNIEEAEMALVQHFRERAEEIVKGVKIQSPSRAILLQKAYDAYLRGEHDLAIPVFLSQADGVCREVFGVEYFTSRKRIKEFETLFESLDCKITKAFLSPIAEETSIEWSEGRRRICGPPPFNRHRILHGDDVSYGTEINSLKAISFLNYVATVFSKNEEELVNTAT